MGFHPSLNKYCGYVSKDVEKLLDVPPRKTKGFFLTDSRHLYLVEVAQQVEHPFEERCASGSIPLPTTKKDLTN